MADQKADEKYSPYFWGAPRSDVRDLSGKTDLAQLDNYVGRMLQQRAHQWGTNFDPQQGEEQWKHQQQESSKQHAIKSRS